MPNSKKVIRKKPIVTNIEEKDMKETMSVDKSILSGGAVTVNLNETPELKPEVYSHSPVESNDDISKVVSKLIKDSIIGKGLRFGNFYISPNTSIGGYDVIKLKTNIRKQIISINEIANFIVSETLNEV